MGPRDCQDADQLEAGSYSVNQEKEFLKQDWTQSSSERLAQAPVEKMPSIRHLLATLLVCFLVTFGLTTAIAPGSLHRRPCNNKKLEAQPVVTEQEQSSFRQLLDAVSQESLHDLLHRYFPDRYKHGVYPSEHSAMEAVHRDNAALATSIVQLAKRQNDNTTTTTPDPPTTTTPDPTTTPPPPGSTTTSPPPPDTTTSPPPGTTTDNPPPASSTPDNSNTPTSAPPDTDTDSPTTSPPPGSTITTSKTNSPPRSSKPVTSTYTSTINGTPTVVVATSYVAADSQDTGTSTRPGGSLQTNGAVPRNRGVVLEAMVGVIVGGVMFV